MRIRDSPKKDLVTLLLVFAKKGAGNEQFIILS